MKKMIMPPTYFMVFLVLAVGLHFIAPIWKFDYMLAKCLGLLLISLGIILNLWTDYMFKKRKTTVKPNEVPASLQTSGPFSISRHPMYLGMLAILIGTSFVLGSLVSFISAFIFIILIEIKFISLEENILQKKFGKKYTKYKKKVRCWI